MSLNIKNEETHRLVRELAALTGESLTVAVTEAVRERRDRLRNDRGSASHDLLRIGRDVAARLPASWAVGDPTEELYDDHGLPA
jgi:antitoxin VapB